MAQITQENIGVQHEKISIHITPEDYLPSVDKAIKNLSKQASIPGFRKGMVPAGLIRKMYGQSVFADEVLRVAGTKLEEHLIAQKAEIFARPVPSASQEQMNFDILKPIAYTFEFEIGTKPSFRVPLIENKESVDLCKVIVTHEMLDQEIEQMLLKAGEMTTPEEVSSPFDILNVDFTRCDADGNPIEGAETKPNSLLLKYFSAGAQQLLQGKKAGDDIIIQPVQDLENSVQAAVIKDLGLEPQGEEAKSTFFKMHITKLGHVEKATLNEETYQKLFPGRTISSETEFKEAVTEEIQKYWDQQARIRLHNEIFERLVHETPIELPADFLKRWLSVGGEQYKSPEQVEREYPGFEHSLRWQLITDRIIEENQLQVEQEELEYAARMEVMQYFGQYGSMPMSDMEWMEPLIKKQLADAKFKDELSSKIITDKVFYVLENTLTLVEQTVSVEEFLKRPTPHHHHH